MLSKNELGLMRANHEDALSYDLEHGLPPTALHCINDVPRLLEEVQRLQDQVLELRYAARSAQQALRVTSQRTKCYAAELELIRNALEISEVDKPS